MFPKAFILNTKRIVVKTVPEREGYKSIAFTGVELALELNPVQPEGMQESRQALHQY